MWRLPKLVWKAAEWRLPLANGTAARLAHALLADDDMCRELLTRALRSDPALWLWSLCQADDWKDTPPPQLEQLAAWFLANGLATFSVSACDDELPATGCHAISATDFLSAHGSLVTKDDLLGCAWFPKWLLDGRPLTAVVEDAADHEGGSLLPLVINQRRRVSMLESRFDQVLEQEKLASLKELAYGASHEINNPLANIATRAQAMLRDESDPERKRKLATIAAQAFRAHEMISDLMLFAKPPLPQRRSTDVVASIRGVMAECAADAVAQDTALTLESSAAAIELDVDPTQFVVAMKALIRNAFEALGTGGGIQIGVHEFPPRADGSESVDISVRDTGPGIAPETRRHLFDPFYSGREAGRGLGFGLAKCWRIAELHGGTISVTSDLGRGATFTLHFPKSASPPLDASTRL